MKPPSAPEVCKTPLESSLERELAAVGLPFGGRKHYYDTVTDRYLSYITTLSRTVIDSIPDDKYRARLQERARTPDWSQFLIERGCTSPTGLCLNYNVFPSMADEKAFKLAAYPDYPRLLSTILRRRTFFGETVSITDPHYFSDEPSPRKQHPSIRFTQDTIDVLAADPRQMFSEAGHEFSAAEETDDPDGTHILVLIDFYAEGMKPFLRSDVPQDLLDGIRCPVKDADVLARRLALFLEEF